MEPLLPTLWEWASLATGAPVTLAAGTHTLTAHYAGDANNASAASAPLTHTVNPATFPIAGGTASVQITGPAGCTLDSLALADATPADALPAHATAPLGVLRFTATGCPFSSTQMRRSALGPRRFSVPGFFGPAAFSARATRCPACVRKGLWHLRVTLFA